MYAIVDIAGQQFKVEKNQKVFVHRLQEEEGSSVEFDNVLLVDNDGKIDVGTPTVSGMMVKAKVVQHLKGDKVKVFKKKRRKGYQKENGHRQYLTELMIEGIVTGKKTAKKETKKEEPKTEPKVTIKKEAPKAESKKEVKGDDLKRVEGIGPKIESIFIESGVDSYAKLADTSVEKLNEILAEAGPRYASKNPGSWPKQAKMAADGKWDDLKEWQENHKGGIE